jgi:hypothetical protein
MAIPFVTATLPLCFSQQICGVVLDNYGIMTIDEENNPALVIINQKTGICRVEKPSCWISWLRTLCDAIYGSSYKNDKIMERDFSEKYFKANEDKEEEEFFPPSTPLSVGSPDRRDKDLEMQNMEPEALSPSAIQLSNFPYRGVPNVDTTDVAVYLLYGVCHDDASLNLPQMVTVGTSAPAEKAEVAVITLRAGSNPVKVAGDHLSVVLQMGKLVIENYYLLFAHSSGATAHAFTNNTLLGAAPSKPMLFTCYLVVVHSMHLVSSGFNFYLALVNTFIEGIAFGGRLLAGHIVQDQYQLLIRDRVAGTDVFKFCEASIISVNAVSYMTSLALQSFIPIAGVGVAINTEFSMLMSTSIGSSHCLAAYSAAYGTVLSDPSCALCMYVRIVVNALVGLALLYKWNVFSTRKVDLASLPSRFRCAVFIVSSITMIDMVVTSVFTVVMRL